MEYWIWYPDALEILFHESVAFFFPALTFNAGLFREIFVSVLSSSLSSLSSSLSSGAMVGVGTAVAVGVGFCVAAGVGFGVAVGAVVLTGGAEIDVQVPQRLVLLLPIAVNVITDFGVACSLYWRKKTPW